MQPLAVDKALFPEFDVKFEVQFVHVKSNSFFEGFRVKKKTLHFISFQNHFQTMGFSVCAWRLFANFNIYNFSSKFVDLVIHTPFNK